MTQAQIHVSNDAPDFAHKLARGAEKFVRDAMAAPLRLASYTVAALPDPVRYTKCMIYVSNESGGAVPAFSDGTNWRRVTDRNIVS